MDEPKPRELLTVAQVAAYFSVNDETVRRWIRAGELPYIDLGRKAGYRLSRRDVETFADARYRTRSKAAA